MMDQSLEYPGFSERNVNVKTTQGGKSNKCKQCNYESYEASRLRRHLKTHSGEKPNKCNQCDFASIGAGDLRTHLKRHF